MSARYVEHGPLSYQQHTDWRCSTAAWRRGKWRPVVSVRFGRAAKPAIGIFLDRDEEGTWMLAIAGIVFDVMAQLTGPWQVTHTEAQP